MIQQMLAIWSLVPLPFLKPAWTSGSSWFTYCWSLAWRILSIILLACEMSAIVWYFEHSLALPFFGIGMKTDLFQSCGHCWAFQISWHIVCSTFTASSFESKSVVAQLCLTFCNPMGCSLPVSSVHGILQARILVWVTTPFSKGSSWPRDQIQVSRIAGTFFIIWATREVLAWQISL